jgi:hypothetical protein
MQDGWFLVAAVTILTLAYAGGWLLTLFGLPGTWLIVAAAACYALSTSASARLAIGWPTVVLLLILALAGEVVESLVGALAAGRVGGSRRGMLLAIAGSLIGGVLGAGAGLPIPLFGPVVGAILGAGGGAFVGSVLGELWKGRALDHGWRVGEAAFWGRIIGSLAKLAVATAMVIVGLLALVF